MTRVLATLLGAAEPHFSLGVKKMERAAGNPSNDIRLTTEVANRSRQKIAELGLDPTDTTAAELYCALEYKLGNDDKIVRKSLAISDSASSEDICGSVVRYVEQQKQVSYQCFALKHSILKKMFKKQPPKKVMKALNYRSVDSLLKHETTQHIYIAALLCESGAWRKKLIENYSKLVPSDFETRNVEVTIPNSKRWVNLAKKATEAQKHNVFVAKELGAVVVLPIDKILPGMAITTLTLVLNALNDVMSAGSLLRLKQVSPDFGGTVREVATTDSPALTKIDDLSVTWKTVHKYYARQTKPNIPVFFEPHVAAADLKWYYPENILANIHPSLAFWRDTRYTAFLHENSFVSLNILDVAINYCNHLQFSDRISVFLRQHLWQEFVLRYLNQENLERAIADELSPKLAYAEVSPEE